MTRYLSEVLGAEEPVFSQGIQQLERASGLPNADIRLTTQAMQAARAKIAELGLDPNDTTPDELYAALHERIKRDETLLQAALRLSGEPTPPQIASAVAQYVLKTRAHTNCFALKTSVAKRLLKAKAPKNAMKKLGYRSLESMLKHEPVAYIYAAAVIAESPAWHKVFREQYNKLQATDFEVRALNLSVPATKRWQTLGAQFAAHSKHAMLTFKELGTVVILPLQDKVDGLAITTALLSIHELNEIRAFSSYIKLQQVKPAFGAIMGAALSQDPRVGQPLAGQHVTWQTIHRFYAHHANQFHPEIFEPHVQPEDLAWQHAEDELAELSPALSFWRGTQNLSFLKDGQPVSINMLDVALSYCNHLSFADRIVHFMRSNLWHELLMRYLNQQNLEEAVERQVAGDLLGDLTLAE